MQVVLLMSPRLWTKMIYTYCSMFQLPYEEVEKYQELTSDLDNHAYESIKKISFKEPIVVRSWV